MNDWLARLNDGGRESTLIAELRACCAAASWVEAILDGRPYSDEAALFAASDAATAALDATGLEQALTAHPRIGERAAASSDATAASSHAAWSRQEQSGVADADASVRAQIAGANQRYEQRFGQVYLVCATGLSAQQLLAVCLERLANDPTTERSIVLRELAKIARIRLSKLLHHADERPSR